MPPRSRQKGRRPGLKAAMAVAGVAATALLGWAALSLTKEASLGRDALQEVKQLVAFGPRPCGSEPHRKTERAIVEKLQAAGIPVQQDRFTGDTPIGPVAMNNIIGRVAGRGVGPGAGRTIVL